MIIFLFCILGSRKLNFNYNKFDVTILVDNISEYI
jgi:hypothetical protein